MVFVLGCSPGPTPASPAEEAEAARILSLLHASDDSTLARSFTQVNARVHTRYSRVWQRIGARRPATAERSIHQDSTGGATVIAQSESGTFEEGFDGISSNALSVETLARLILEGDPPHLSTRFAEDYVYRMLPDTAWWGRAIQVIAIDARAEATQPVRTARYYLDQGTVVGVYMARERTALSFAERSQYYVQMRPGAESAWVPYHVYLSTDLKLLFRRTRSQGRSSTLFQYRDNGS